MDTKNNLRKQLREILKERGYDIWCVAGKDGIDGILAEELDQILTLITEEIKQRLLTDEEMVDVIDKAPAPSPMEFKDEPVIRATAQAQLDKVLKEMK